METTYGVIGGRQWVLEVVGARLTDEEMEAAVAMVPTPEAEWTQQQVERELLAVLRRQYRGIDAMVMAHPPELEVAEVLAGGRGVAVGEVRWLQVRHSDGSWGETPEAAEVAVGRDKWQALPAGVTWEADHCCSVEVVGEAPEGGELCRCLATRGLVLARGILPEVR